MKKPKILFLLLSLVLPVAIFLFLKFFGKNQFDLPVMYTSEAEWPAECSRPDFPFILSDSLKNKVGNVNRPVFILLKALDAEGATRLPEEVDTSRVRIIQMVGDSTCDDYTNSSPFRRILFPCGTEIHCLAGAGASDAAILADENGRVRSVFKSFKREEVDRAIMEIKILLKDY